MDSSFNTTVHAQSLETPFQGSSEIFSCKWAWCRCTFFDKASLVHHVIHEHARRSIPVRRRDVAIARRIEEGSGGSLHMSSLVRGVYASSPEEPSQTSDVLGHSIQGSSSNYPAQHPLSLPSPPISSPSIDTSYLRGEPVLGGDEQHNDATLYMHNFGDQDGNEREGDPSSAMLPEYSMTSGQPDQHPTPTFASFDYQSGTPSPISIPPSPSFSSLVSAKRTAEFVIPEPKAGPQAQTLLSRSHPLSQSTSTVSSSVSQESVAMQLTQSLSTEDSTDSDEDSAPDRDVRKTKTQSNCKPAGMELSADDANDENLYSKELSWPSSQSHENYEVLTNTGSEKNVDSQETRPVLGKFDIMPQPASQLTHNTILIHNHAPTKPRISIPDESASSASIPLGTPAPLASPTFAVSTPIRQNWYQPIPRHKSSQMSKNSQPDQGILASGIKSQPESVNRQISPLKTRSPTKKRSIFRSGTLQIRPIIPEPLPAKEETKSQLTHAEFFPQDSQPDLLDAHEKDSLEMDNDSYEQFSYPPLQTQAPYESQYMSQS